MRNNSYYHLSLDFPVIDTTNPVDAVISDHCASVLHGDEWLKAPLTANGAKQVMRRHGVDHPVPIATNADLFYIYDAFQAYTWSTMPVDLKKSWKGLSRGDWFWFCPNYVKLSEIKDSYNASYHVLDKALAAEGL